MNNKEILEKIKLSAIFIMNDSEYNHLLSLLENNKYNKARIFIDTLLEEKEINKILGHDEQGFIVEYEALDNLQDFIIELIVNEEDNNDRRKQFNQTIR